MQEYVNWFIGKLPAFINFMASCQIVSGVSLLHFLLGLMVISMLLKSFLHVSR